ncbi:MAG: family 16 glycoside hydrolase [Planctomycetota bacterium]
MVKTWVNGIPAANWVDDGTYREGFFGLQIHKGKQGKVRFRDIRVKELP